MSWLSDRLGIHLGNVGAPIGAALGSVIPGVGTAIGAGIGGAIGGVGHGDGLAKSALEGAGSYAGAKALTSGGDGGGIGGFLKSHLGSLAGGAASLLGGGSGGGINPLVGGLAAAQTANAAMLGRKANDFADKGWQLANDSYTARSGLRSQGIDQLLHPQQRTVPGLDQIRQQNVSARPGMLRSAVGG